MPAHANAQLLDSERQHLHPHGNCPNMTALGGFGGRRTSEVGELHCLKTEQDQKIIDATFVVPAKQRAQLPVIITPDSDQPLPTFAENKKGQFGFEF